MQTQVPGGSLECPGLGGVRTVLEPNLTERLAGRCPVPEWASDLSPEDDGARVRIRTGWG